MHRKLFNPHDMDCACSTCSRSNSRMGNKYKNGSCNGSCDGGCDQPNCDRFPKFDCRPQPKNIATNNLEVQKKALINDLTVKCMGHFNNIEVGCNAEINNLNVLEKTNLQCLDVECFAHIRDLTVMNSTELEELRVNGNTKTHNLNVCDQTDLFNLDVENKANLRDLCVLGKVKLVGDDICIGNNKLLKPIPGRKGQKKCKEPSKTVIKGDLCVGSGDPKTDLTVKGNTLLECDVVAPGYVCLGTCDGRSISITDIKGNLGVGKNVTINQNLEVCGDLLVKGQVMQTTDEDICIEGRLLVKDEVCILGDNNTDAILKVDKIATNPGNNVLAVCADLEVEGDFCTNSFSTDQINCKNNDQILINCDLCVGSGHTLLTDTIMGKAAINPQTTVNNDLIVEGDLCIEQKLQVDEIECKDPGDPTAKIEVNCDLCLNSTLLVDNIEAKDGGPIIVSDDLCLEGALITNNIECKYPLEGIDIDCDVCITGSLEINEINAKDDDLIIVGNDLCLEGALITNNIQCKYPSGELDIDCDVSVIGQISTTMTPTAIIDSEIQTISSGTETSIIFANIVENIGDLVDIANNRIILNETNSTYIITLFLRMEQADEGGIFEGIISYEGNGNMGGVSIALGPPKTVIVSSSAPLYNEPDPNQPKVVVTAIIRTGNTLLNEYVTGLVFQNSGDDLDLTDACLSVTKIA